MASIPAYFHSEFTFLFLAVRRADCTSRPFPVRTTACNEHDARLRLVADFILCFAGRLPVEVNE